jgi:hypothetical protein
VSQFLLGLLLVDGLKSIKNELESVSITTTKHPRSLKGVKVF